MELGPKAYGQCLAPSLINTDIIKTLPDKVRNAMTPLFLCAGSGAGGENRPGGVPWPATRPLCQQPSASHHRRPLVETRFI